ncbi:MAG: hypothetical protein KDC75_24290, partial [Phaeodactylibacter sp.]|nr:hypothetical protein [Phaeodactylibacter sp.]
MIKNLTLLLALPLFFSSLLAAQSCLPNGVVFTSQAQVDSFPLLYPGCSRVEGGVGINFTDITHLDSLRACWGIINWT